MVKSCFFFNFLFSSLGVHLVQRMSPEKRAEFIESISSMKEEEDATSVSSTEGEI